MTSSGTEWDLNLGDERHCDQEARVLDYLANEDPSPGGNRLLYIRINSVPFSYFAINM